MKPARPVAGSPKSLLQRTTHPAGVAQPNVRLPDEPPLGLAHFIVQPLGLAHFIVQPLGLAHFIVQPLFLTHAG